MTIARLLRIAHQRLRSLVRKDAVDAEVARELAFHFDLLVAEHVTSGMPLDDARRAARRALGNVAVLEERCRDHRRVSWAHDLRQDLSYGLRVLAKNRAFTLVAAVSLALGLGANAATLGVLHTLRVLPLAVPDADRLFVLRTFSLANPAQVSGVPLGDYLAWRERSRTFVAFGMSLGAPGDLGAEGGEPAERIEGHLFDAGAVSALGVRSFLGRVFTDDDPRFGTPGSVIVISHRLWTGRYHADPAVVGRQIRLNRSLVTVIGVMPPSFAYPDDRIDYWGPMWTLKPGAKDEARLYNVFGRLRPGVSVAEAEADLGTITSGQWGVRARPLRDVLYGWATAPLVTVEAAVALVLLMACANVAALLLARGAARSPELALRMALGAGRGRIIRQLLTESVLLSCIGGSLGLFVAAVSVRALRTLAPLPGQSAIPPVAIDARLLTITALLAAGTTLVFGVLPAFRSSRLPLVDRFKGLQRTTAGIHQQVLRSSLVAGQIAVAFVLLIGAALLTTSFARLAARDLHFDPDNLITFDFRIPPTEFIRAAGTKGGSAHVEISSLPSSTLDRVHARLRALPGVVSVAGISHHPTNTLVLARPLLTVAGRPAPRDAEGAAPVYFQVTPGFFGTMRTPVIRGREFEAGDTKSSPWVAIVNETLARTIWPGQDAIGKRIRLDVSSDEQVREIVGVVRDIPTRRAQLLADPVVYASTLQQPSTSRVPFAGMFGRMTFVLRIAGDPATLGPAVRRAVAEVEPDRPLANIVSGRIERYFWGRYSYVFVLAAFALAATLLASIGVYGVMSCAVAERLREIAVRIALGADARDVFTAVARQALTIVSIGLGVGIAGALGLTRFISSQLWGISATDPLAFLTVALLLATVAAAACVVPVRRALGTDPVSVLKSE
jgi:putative ABC transport system permease protein